MADKPLRRQLLEGPSKSVRAERDGMCVIVNALKIATDDGAKQIPHVERLGILMNITLHFDREARRTYVL